MKTDIAAKSLGAASALVTVLAALSVFSLGAVPAHAVTRVEVKTMVVEEANNSRVPPSLALAVAKVESDFQDAALSPAGARGVMQIMPATATGEYGVDPDETWDARLNIQLGIDFLDRLIERYDGRWDLALSHYNGGSVRGVAIHRGLAGDAKIRRGGSQVAEALCGAGGVWLADDGPEEGWRSARTRVAKAANTVEAHQPAVTSHFAWIPTIVSDARDWTIGTWRTSVRGSLDDYDEGMDLRLLLARGRLDDYSPIITWTGG